VVTVTATEPGVPPGLMATNSLSETATKGTSAPPIRTAQSVPIPESRLVRGAPVS